MELHQHSQHLLAHEIRWELVQGSGQLFTPRTGHTVCADNSLVYLFGGADLEQRTSELYSFDPSNNKWRLIQIADNNVPAARSGAHSVYFEGSVYLFGGYTRKGGTYFNDLSQFSIAQQQWVTVQPQSKPPTPRTDHSLVIYQSQLFVYGGRDETHIFADVFRYSLFDHKWAEVHFQAMKPEEAVKHGDFDILSKLKLRFGHTACVYKHFMYVFGGWDGHQTLNDFAVLDLKNQVWLKPSKVQGTVEGRYRHSASATNTALYVFGGINQVQKRFNDVHEFVFESQTWTRRIAVANFEPSTRTFHQSVIFQNWLYVFGGFDGNKTNNVYRAQVHAEPEQKPKPQIEESKEVVTPQLHISLDEYFQQFDLLEWTKKVTAGTVFTPRTGHECILADGLIFLFGGTDDEERLNDLYSYNIRANTWEKILTEGPVPLPRSGARGVAYMDGLYFFGGYQRKQGTYFNDLFYFDIDKKKWTVICQNELQQSAQQPTPRTDHTAVLWEGSMYIFGGYDGKARYNDLHKFKLRNHKYQWARVEAEGTLPLNRFGHSAVVCKDFMFIIGGWNGHDTMDDVFQYSFLSNLWFEVRRIKGTRPKPRYRHSAIACKNEIIIFGGVDTSQQRFNDLYKFNVDQRRWEELKVTGQVPQSRTFHKSVLIKNVMYVVGGFDGSRLNDLYHISIDKSGSRSDSDEVQSVMSQRRGPPTSAASGIMQTVPSDLSIDQQSNSDLDEDDKWDNNRFLRKKVKLLQKQVRELTILLTQEEASMDDCCVCYSRVINSVFLDCGHRIMCHHCATFTVLAKQKNEAFAKCPLCREPVKKIIKTYNP